MSESNQHKLDRVRPPRVQITYDVETGGAIEKKQLPLVVGVMADLAGNAGKTPQALKKRKFVEIDRDNFGKVMKSIEPGLKYKVPNQMSDEGGELSVDLKFGSMNDFDPVAVLKQIPALKDLFEARQRLSDLIVKLDGNDDLDRLLRSVVEKTDELQTIKGQIAPPATPTEPAADA